MWKGITIAGVFALLAATAAALGDVSTIVSYAPWVTEMKLAGELEPLTRSLRVQSSKQANAEINALEFQKAFLTAKKVELELLAEKDDSQLIRETLATISDQLEETKANLRKAKCDLQNISNGIDVECSR